MQLRQVNCYNCNSNACESYADENGYHLVRCTECGLLYVRHCPDDAVITQAHQTGQHGGASALEVTGIFNWQKVAKYRRMLSDIYMEERPPTTMLRWLDIGCGHGEFLVALHEFFGPLMRAQGVEPNVHKQASARRHGVDVAFFDLENHEEKYDRISLLNVYSHLPNPPEILGVNRAGIPGRSGV